MGNLTQIISPHHTPPWVSVPKTIPSDDTLMGKRTQNHTSEYTLMGKRTQNDTLTPYKNCIQS